MVNINEVFSKKTVTFGVLQGTVLEPLVLTFYTNGFSNVKSEGKILIFTDHIVITCTGNTYEDVIRKIEADCHIINKKAHS